MEAKLVLAGYFGCGNLGDDAILAGFLEGIAGFPVRPIALSGFPEQTYRTLQVHAIPRMNYSAISEALQGAEALVFPGGSIFQDVTSLRSIYYYSKLVSMGKKLTGRVILLGQGFGPVNRFLGKSRAASMLRQIDAIAVRDEAAARGIVAMGARCEVTVTADMAWLAKPDASAAGGGFGLQDQQAIGLVPRVWGRAKPIAEAFVQFSRAMSGSGHMPIMVPLDEAGDQALYKEMEKLGGNPTMIKGVRTPQAMMARIERMSGVVTMRYHGAIFAAKAGIPPILVSYDPKVTHLSDILEVPAAIPVERLSSDLLIKSWENYEARRDYLATRIGLVRQTMEAKAQANIELLCRHVPSLKGQVQPNKVSS
jgi:polysaccharide pyruvyl transferase CsaB